jgi:hypothetical protein
MTTSLLLAGHSSFRQLSLISYCIARAIQSLKLFVEEERLVSRWTQHHVLYQSVMLYTYGPTPTKEPCKHWITAFSVLPPPLV